VRDWEQIRVTIVHPKHTAVPVVYEVVPTPFTVVVIRIFIQNKFNPRLQVDRDIMSMKKVVDFAYIIVNEYECCVVEEVCVSKHPLQI
jgi:hypothetical protein